MGVYVNPPATMMEMDRRSPVYVDKSGLLDFANSVLGTSERYICVSRPRRFGKTMAANMLLAYYRRVGDSSYLFEDLAIAKLPSYRQYLNKYNVVFINALDVWEQTDSLAAWREKVELGVTAELRELFPRVRYSDETNLLSSLAEIFAQTGEQFVFIIDEWDCLAREAPNEREELQAYLHFLRSLLKDKGYVALAYITGILPVRKYGSQSALNMFREYTMTGAYQLAEYVGFTEAEVRALCERSGLDFAEVKRWYDGYLMDQGLHVYSPCSVVQAVRTRSCQNFWTSTESFEALRQWLGLDLDGLRTAVVKLLEGQRIPVDVACFNNSFSDIHSRDAVLALLVHLGYLGLDSATQEVFVPNLEIAAELSRSVQETDWREISVALQKSLETVNAVWRMDGDAVAEAIESAHYETSILDYNNEKALRYTVLFAFYAARRYYKVVQECPTGKGFADMIFLPTPSFADKPALVVELKWNTESDTAIKQIKEKRYPQALAGYSGRLLLVGISYDKESKKHECVIEECEHKAQQ